MQLKINKAAYTFGAIAVIAIFILGMIMAASPFKVHTSLFSEEPATATKVFNAKETTLENGLRVVVVENHRVPVVTHMIWYANGAADERTGETGTAHFLEHLMFKGSDDLAPGEFSRIVKSLGGNDNAFTSQDYTAYYQSVPVEHLETVMRMEAGRMRGLKPPMEEVKSEHLVVLEERRQRTDNNPEAKFYEQFKHALFPNHPYGNPVIGWMPEMEKLNWRAAKHYYDTWYRPNNAILVIAGDVNAEDVFSLAQEIYGHLLSSPLPKRERPQIPSLPAQTKLTLHDKNIKEPSFIRGYIAPSAHQDKTAALALQILEEVIGGGPSSRLYRSLVIEQQLATSISFSYSGSAWEYGQITIEATPKPGVSLETLELAIDAELEKLMKDGITQEELSDAITRIEDAAIYARDSLSGPAMVIGYALVTGSSLDDVEYWPRDIAAINAKQVLDAANAYLDPANPYKHPPVTGYLLPEKTGEMAQ